MSALAQLINEEQIALDIEVSNRDELFKFAGQFFENLFSISADVVTQCLLEREILGSTGLGHGIAIPHGRVKKLSHTHLALIRAKQGIQFNAPDQQDVRIFVVMLVPEQANQSHLEILSEIAQVVSDTTTQQRLFTETSTQSILDTLISLNHRS